MPRLDRYLFDRLLPHYAITLTATLVVGLLDPLLRFFTRPPTLIPPPATFVQLIASSIPTLATFALPAAFLAASLVTLSRLGTDGELIALAASGISPWRLSRPLLAIALVVTAVTYAAAAYGDPWSRRHTKQLLRDLEADALERSLTPGTLVSPAPGLTLARQPPPDPGLFLADDRHPARRYQILAQNGRMDYQKQLASLALELQHGTLVTAGPDGRYDSIRFQSLRLELPLPGTSWRLEPADLYPQELEARIARLRQANRQTTAEQLALEKKRAFPASSLAFALLAVPLGSYRGRVPRSRGYLLAMAVILAYYLMIRLIDGLAASTAAALHLEALPRLMVWAPNAVLALSGALALWRRSRYS